MFSLLNYDVCIAASFHAIVNRLHSNTIHYKLIHDRTSLMSPTETHMCVKCSFVGFEYGVIAHTKQSCRSNCTYTLRKKWCLKGSSLVPYMEPFMVLKGTTKGS